MMKCTQCPISLVCYSGRIAYYVKRVPHLCPICGNFFTDCMPLSECSETAIKLDMRGFQCERRRITEAMKKEWHRLDNINKLYIIDDPVVEGTKLFICPCNFCYNSYYSYGRSYGMS